MPYSISLGFNRYNTTLLEKLGAEIKKTLRSYEPEYIPAHINIVENLTKAEGVEIMEKVLGLTWEQDDLTMRCNGLLTFYGEISSVVLRWKETKLTRAIRQLSQQSIGYEPEPNEKISGYQWMCKTTIALTKEEIITIKKEKAYKILCDHNDLDIKYIHLIHYSKGRPDETFIEHSTELNGL